MGPRRTRCLCNLPIYIENFQALLLASVLEIWCCPQLIVLVNLIYGRLSCGVTVLSGLMMVCAVCGIAVFVNAQKVSSLNYLRSPVMSSHQMILSVKKGSHRQPWIVQQIVKLSEAGQKQTIPGQMMTKLIIVSVIFFLHNYLSKNIYIFFLHNSLVFLLL